MTTVHHRTRTDRGAGQATGQRVSFYARATDGSDLSVERQEAVLRTYLADHHDLRVVATYRDTAAGTRAVRPGRQMLGAFAALHVHRKTESERQRWEHHDNGWPGQPAKAGGDPAEPPLAFEVYQAEGRLTAGYGCAAGVQHAPSRTR